MDKAKEKLLELVEIHREKAKSYPTYSDERIFHTEMALHIHDVLGMLIFAQLEEFKRRLGNG